nr:hypothetical protein Iba_chr10aCG11710 [Ipomoea batatas]
MAHEARRRAPSGPVDKDLRSRAASGADKRLVDRVGRGAYRPRPYTGKHPIFVLSTQFLPVPYALEYFAQMAHSVTDLFARAKDGDEIHRRDVAPLKKALAKRYQRVMELESKLKTSKETGKRETGNRAPCSRGEHLTLTIKVRRPVTRHLALTIKIRKPITGHLAPGVSTLLSPLSKVAIMVVGRFIDDGVIKCLQVDQSTVAVKDFGKFDDVLKMENSVLFLNT